MTLASELDRGPIFVAHRGNASTFPEETMAAFRASADLGLALEMDVWRLQDGGLAVFHDWRVDRLTTSSGKVGEFSTASWQQLEFDAASWFAPGEARRDLGAPPLFNDLLREFGGKVLLVPEIKSANVGEPMADAIERLGLQGSVLVSSYVSSYMEPLRRIGSATAIIDEAASTPSAVHLANGDSWVIVDRARAPHEAVRSYLAAGLKVAVFNITRHRDRQIWSSVGVHAFISGDAHYLRATLPSAPHRSTSDPFANQTFWHGQHAGTGNDKGVWIGSDRWGFADGTKRFVQQGWSAPLSSSAPTIEFKLTFDRLPSDPSRWVGISIVQDDGRYDDVTLRRNGYLILLRTNGSMELWRQTDAGNTTKIGMKASAGIREGATVPVTIKVTSTEIRITRGDTADVLAVEDSTFRGRYMHFGVDGTTGLHASFSDVVVE